MNTKILQNLVMQLCKPLNLPVTVYNYIWSWTVYNYSQHTCAQQHENMHILTDILFFLCVRPQIYLHFLSEPPGTVRYIFDTLLFDDAKKLLYTTYLVNTLKLQKCVRTSFFFFFLSKCVRTSVE